MKGLTFKKVSHLVEKLENDKARLNEQIQVVQEDITTRTPEEKEKDLAVFSGIISGIEMALSRIDYALKH